MIPRYRLEAVDMAGLDNVERRFDHRIFSTRDGFEAFFSKEIADTNFLDWRIGDTFVTRFPDRTGYQLFRQR
jgi:hypothetical protein